MGGEIDTIKFVLRGLKMGKTRLIREAEARRKLDSRNLQMDVNERGHKSDQEDVAELQNLDDDKKKNVKKENDQAKSRKGSISSDTSKEEDTKSQRSNKSSKQSETTSLSSPTSSRSQNNTSPGYLYRLVHLKFTLKSHDFTIIISYLMHIHYHFQ